MIPQQNLCKSYLLERELGIHIWGTDVMKLALYQAPAVLNPDVITQYTAANETVGTGYVAGGYVLALTAGFPKLSVTARKCLIDFQDIAVNPAVFSTRRGLIYNASKANRAVAVIEFGFTYNVAVSFALVWPPNDDNNCIMRLGA